jgi:hypothetical protein
VKLAKLLINTPLTVFLYAQKVAGFDKNYYMPLRETDFVSTSFYVGMGTKFKSPGTNFFSSSVFNIYLLTHSLSQNENEVSGEIVCYANDAFGLYWNNSGEITVRFMLSNKVVKLSNYVLNHLDHSLTPTTSTGNC